MVRIGIYTIDIILFLLAVFLILLLTPINYFYVEERYRYSLTTAYELDLFGNYHYAPMFNALLIKDNGYKFGLKGETISSTLGRNILKKTLTKKGKVLVWILSEKHCLEAIKF